MLYMISYIHLSTKSWTNLNAPTIIDKTIVILFSSMYIRTSLLYTCPMHPIKNYTGKTRNGNSKWVLCMNSQLILMTNISDHLIQIEKLKWQSRWSKLFQRRRSWSTTYFQSSLRHSMGILTNTPYADSITTESSDSETMEFYSSSSSTDGSDSQTSEEYNLILTGPNTGLYTVRRTGNSLRT